MPQELPSAHDNRAEAGFSGVAQGALNGLLSEVLDEVDSNGFTRFNRMQPASTDSTIPPLALREEEAGNETDNADCAECSDNSAPQPNRPNQGDAAPSTTGQGTESPPLITRDEVQRIVNIIDQYRPPGTNPISEAQLASIIRSMEGRLPLTASLINDALEGREVNQPTMEQAQQEIQSRIPGEPGRALSRLLPTGLQILGGEEWSTAGLVWSHGRDLRTLALNEEQILRRLGLSNRDASHRQ